MTDILFVVKSRKKGESAMKNKYITERERYQIEALYKQGCKPKEIAELLGRCLATIYNELKRGMTKQRHSDLTEYETYLADVAQEKATYNATNKGRDLKIGNDHKYAEYVTDLLLNKKYSPYAVVQHIKNNDVQFDTNVCKNTLYNYIKIGLFDGVSMNTLPCPRKSQNKGTVRRRVALNNSVCKSIEDRDKTVMKRNEYGHWEMDTVVSGKGGKGALLVLTERTTREEEIYKIDSKTIKEVCTCLDSIEISLGLSAFQEKYKTITCDNGVEFLDSEWVETSISSPTARTELYYCHPYCSSERGSNENANRLIRRWIPKGADISQYDREYIEKIQTWMNNYPRGIFGGLSANDLLEGKRK